MWTGSQAKPQAELAELVDAQDSGSCVRLGHPGSSPGFRISEGKVTPSPRCLVSKIPEKGLPVRIMSCRFISVYPPRTVYVDQCS